MYLVLKALSHLSLTDIESLFTEQPSRSAKRWQTLMIQTSGVLNRTPCFWSCRSGRRAARLDSINVTDMDHPILKLLFQYTQRLQCQLRATQLSYALSRAYVNTIRELNYQPSTITIYLGSDKAIEPTGFHVGNNFWMAELPELQKLYQQGWVKQLRLEVLDSIGRSLHSWDLHRDQIKLPCWRRYWHPMDSEASRSSFVDHCRTLEDWSRWRCTPARPYITFNRLLHLARRWRRYRRCRL